MGHPRHPTYRFECSKAFYSEVWHQLVISSSSARHQKKREIGKKGKKEKKEKKEKKRKREKEKKRKREKKGKGGKGKPSAHHQLIINSSSTRHQFVISSSSTLHQLVIRRKEK